MTASISSEALDQVFLKARTHNAWQKRDVSDDLLRQLVDVLKMGPTSANCSPARFVFVKSAEAKARLKPHLMDGNVEKTMAAPVTAIIATNYRFYDSLPMLFPHTDAQSWFTGNKDLADLTAFRNATLQGGYFILAARALDLDCGPMSGFNNAGVDKDFLSREEYRSNFLCNLGYGDPVGLEPRSPRFDFDEMARII